MGLTWLAEGNNSSRTLQVDPPLESNPPVFLKSQIDQPRELYESNFPTEPDR